MSKLSDAEIEKLPAGKCFGEGPLPAGVPADGRPVRPSSKKAARKPPPSDGQDYSDNAIAVRFHELHHETLTFYEGHWWEYAEAPGGGWRWDGSKEAYARIRLKFLTTMPELLKNGSGAECADALRKCKQVNCAETYLKAAETHFQRPSDMPLDGPETDAYLPLQNCVIDIKAYCRGLAHTIEYSNSLVRELGFTRIMPVKYDASAKCPRFDRYINYAATQSEDLAHSPHFDLKEAKERVRYFLRCGGMYLTGEEIKHFLFILGVGNAGKSAFTYYVKLILGEYWQLLSHKILDPKGSSSEITDLFGMRAGQVSELDDKSPFPLSFMKQVSGEEGVTARELYKSNKTARQTFLISMSANSVGVGGVKIPVHDGALVQRLALLPFMYAMPVTDKRIKEEIGRTELSGILNRFLEGLKDFYKGGLNPPKTIADEKADLISRCSSGAFDGYREPIDNHIRSWDSFATDDSPLYHYINAKGPDGIERACALSNENCWWIIEQALGSTISDSEKTKANLPMIMHGLGLVRKVCHMTDKKKKVQIYVPVNKTYQRDVEIKRGILDKLIEVSRRTSKTTGASRLLDDCAGHTAIGPLLTGGAQSINERMLSELVSLVDARKLEGSFKGLLDWLIVSSAGYEREARNHIEQYDDHGRKLDAYGAPIIEPAEPAIEAVEPATADPMPESLEQVAEQLDARQAALGLGTWAEMTGQVSH